MGCRHGQETFAQGLMNGPRRRAKVRHPGFTPVGIGAAKHGDHPVMVTQGFAGA